MTYVLLPCPFCGATGPTGPEVLPQPDGWKSVRCGQCGAMRKAFTRFTRDVVAAWNGRHAPPRDDLEVELGRLKVALEAHDRGEEPCPWRGSCLTKALQGERDKALRERDEARELVKELEAQISAHNLRRRVLWGEE